MFGGIRLKIIDFFLFREGAFVQNTKALFCCKIASLLSKGASIMMRSFGFF